MAELEYVTGDATQPQGEGAKVICHCCNDIGGWGSGFVLALSRRWSEPEMQYRLWHRGECGPAFELGQVLFVQVEENLWVANIIGQHKTIRQVKVPVRYEALDLGLAKVASFCEEKSATAHMPRLGAGLAGGEWHLIEKIILENLVHRGIESTVYDLP